VLRETTSRGLCGIVCPSVRVEYSGVYELGDMCVFYYCRTYYKAVHVVGEESGGHRSYRSGVRNLGISWVSLRAVSNGLKGTCSGTSTRAGHHGRKQWDRVCGYVNKRWR